MKASGQRPHNGWEMAYDFLNDIFAALVPGSFFLSYFLFMAILFADRFHSLGEFVEKLGVIFPLMVVALAYSFGAFFQRREIKRNDRVSAKHIYRKMPHSSGHSFAFANALPDAYLTKICRLLEYWWNLDEKDAALNNMNAEAEPEKTGKINTRIESITKILEAYPDASKSNEAEKYAEYIVKKLLLFHCDNNDGIDSELSSVNDKIWKRERRTLKERVEEEVYLKGAIAESSTFEKLTLVCRVRVRVHFYLVKHAMPFWARIKLTPKDYSELCKKRLISSLPSTLSGGTEIVQARNNFKTLKRICKALTDVNKVIGTFQPKSKANDDTMAARRLRHLEGIQKYIDHDINPSIDWPYTNMKRYCGDRGLEFESEVTWGDGAMEISAVDEIWLTTDNKVSDEIKRSKSSINTAKMKIALAEPELNRAISRNEAHIRYISSIWYATHLVMPVSLVFLAISLAVAIVGYQGYMAGALANTWVSIFHFGDAIKVFCLSLFYIIACFCISHSGKEILHYQRVREITMILQALYIIKGKAETRDSPKVAS